MKYLLFISVLFSISGVFAQQHQLVNSDFENIITIDTTWSDGSTMSYDSIAGGIWGNGNVLLPDFPSTEDLDPFMKDTSFAQSGNHAVLLRTQMIGPAVATGNLFTGFLYPNQLDLNAPLFGAKTGVPFPYRPISFNGYYYYESVNQDSCWMACLLTKWNTTTQSRDTIGYGEYYGYTSTTGFEPFSVTVNYNVPSPTLPDSVSLMLISSGGGLNYQGQPGSTLILDSLWFDQPADASIEELENLPYSISTTNGELTIEFNTIQQVASLSVYDLSGKLIHRKESQKVNRIIRQLGGEKVYLIKIKTDSFQRTERIYMSN